jgi:ribosome maturation factor RimP
MLEVSSPGIDRPLRTAEHFERFAGETAVVKTTSPIEGRSSFTGMLEGFEDGKVLVNCDGMRYELPLEMVKRANVKGTVDFK